MSVDFRKGLALSVLWADVPVSERTEFLAQGSLSSLPQLARGSGLLSVARYVAVSGGPFFIEISELTSEDQADRECAETQRVTREALVRGGVDNNAIERIVYRQIFPVDLDERNAIHGAAAALQIGRMGVSPQHEEEFNEQYNTESLVGYLRVPGVYSARRYINSRLEHPHMTIYELANDKISRQPEWDRVRAQSIWRRRIERFVTDAPGSPGIYRRIGSTE